MPNKRIAWVTDSTAYITEELAAHPDVYVLPLSITFNDDTYEDGVDLTSDELYKKIRADKEVPKTSQPPAGRFAELYDILKEKYDAAVSVHISSQLSGTYSSALQGQEISGFQVEVVDSLSMSYAITTLIERGMKQAGEGVDPATIGENLQAEAKRSECYVLLGSLEQFYKGGRMSGASYLIGNLLKVKPIIKITNEGTFEVFQKVRSEKKAIRRMAELLGEARKVHTIHGVQIMHGNAPAKAAELKQLVEEKFADLDIVVGEISSTIAVHAGEGTLGMVWHNEEA
ncbi:DegV family protein [Alkalicoccus halolimnae]|uniref:DegV family protein n=1 Tax=Alkalicoccus halolimnae TaxID=1667239 RepID=A0A5C7FL46_9BACI|nr:DegV family protein [Alkalicoccus halolimnae]TXF86106.1 DegV family protein [Alkalicoccus halolimnae]